METLIENLTNESLKSTIESATINLTFQQESFKRTELRFILLSLVLFLKI